MSKSKGASTPVIHFQKSNLRNAAEWESITDDNGRVGVRAKNGGVGKRCGALVAKLKKVGGVVSLSDLTDQLQRLEASYNAGDALHGLRRLMDIGVVQHTKTGYKLTPKGVQRWQSTAKV